MATAVTTNTVRLVVYDISGGMARNLASSFLGFDLDYIPHTGVIIFGQEYFYGGGIQKMPHEQVIAMFGIQPCRREVLGKTEKTLEEFHLFLNSISSRFQPTTYDVFRNNCNHFSDEIVKFLLNGTGIPSEIVNLPERVLATPMGQMLAPIWSNMQQRMQEQFVPFNSAPTSSSFPPASSVSPNRTAAAAATTASAVPASIRALMDPTTPKHTLVESLKGLQEATSSNPKDSMVALDTLGKILRNIIANPMEEKYRRLSLQNEKFNSALGKYSEGVASLMAVGFIIEPSGTHIYMAADPAKWERLLMSEKIIVAARKKAIKMFLEHSKVTNVADAFKLVDKSDMVCQEVVQSMFAI
jgi:hypothetical protein